MTLTPAQTGKLVKSVDRRLSEVREQAVADAIATVMAIPIIVMHDDFGFGKVRLQRFLQRFKAHYDCLGDTVSLVDLVELAEELAGVRLFER